MILGHRDYSFHFLSLDRYLFISLLLQKYIKALKLFTQIHFSMSVTFIIMPVVVYFTEKVKKLYFPSLNSSFDGCDENLEKVHHPNDLSHAFFQIRSLNRSKTSLSKQFKVRK